MSDKVVGLDGKAVEAAVDYHLEVTNLLEEALADAKKHKAHSVAVVLIVPNGKTEVDGYDIDLYWHGRRLSLLAGASRLGHRVNAKCDEAMEVIT